MGKKTETQYLKEVANEITLSIIREMREPIAISDSSKKEMISDTFMTLLKVYTKGQLDGIERMEKILPSIFQKGE